MLAIFLAILLPLAVTSQSQPLVAFRGAVIEHVSFYPSNPVTSVAAASAILTQNLDALQPRIILAAQRDSASVVLLSELALTSLVQDRAQMLLFLPYLPAVGSNPCTDAQPGSPHGDVVKRLSCLARNQSIYLSVNWGDAVSNASAPHGFNQYNTQIVFSTNGSILVKYYKIHTFSEVEFDSPAVPELAFFSIGSVRIGIMTCFDTMFASPAIDLMRSHNVDTFLISHWWVDQNAMMNAVTWFAAISKTYGVNIMAAASVWDKVQPWGSGSGIFSNGAVLASYYDTGAKNLVDVALVADVPVLTSTNVEQLPALTPPLDLAGTPPHMCVKHTIVDPKLLVAGSNFTVTVPCLLHLKKERGNFTCTVSASVRHVDLDPKSGVLNETWIVYQDWGYYIMPDGNNIYYFEQFCTLYRCPNDGNLCLATDDQFRDDTGGYVQFDYAQMEANFDVGSVPFVMASDGVGNVFGGLADSSHMVQGLTGATVTSIPTVARIDLDGRPVINFSILSRLFSDDAKFGA